MSDGSAELNPLLAAAVAYGIEGAVPFPNGPLADEPFDRLVDECLHQRLLGALAEAASHGSLVVTEAQRARLADQHAASQGHMLVLERTLLRVADVFGELGVEFRVLKGVGLAHLIYAEPSWRASSDLDLLVPSAQFDAAVAGLIDRLGGEQDVPELRPGFDREFGKEALVRVGPVEVDLHRTFVTGPFGLTIDLDEMFAEASPFDIDGRRLAGLGAEHLVMHACINVALGDLPVRLGSVRDLLLCQRESGVDTPSTAALAHRWRVSAPVRRAAELAVGIAGPVAAGELADLAQIEVPRREAWLLRSYLSPARSYSRPLASLAVIRGVRPRARYARALVAPSADYLRSRGWTGRSHVRRAYRRLRRHG
jgi:hypothetical protein